jgi:hypothetical protein
MQSHLDPRANDIGNCIGDLNTVTLPSLLRLFNLHTYCAKAVYDVIRVITVKVWWTPVAFRGYFYLKRDGLLNGLFNFLL